MNGNSSDLWEAVTLRIKDVSCGTYHLSAGAIGCSATNDGFGNAVVIFYPQKNCCERRFTLVAKDQAGLEGSLTVAVPNRPPSLRLSQSNQAFEPLKPGKKVEVRLDAEDPDRDSIEITLEQPYLGMLATEKEDPWKVSGTWTWTVPDPYRGLPWQLVTFQAVDNCGASSLAYLLVRISTPPQPYNRSAWVKRGGTARIGLYVYDPDTPPAGLSFGFQEPPGLLVRLVSVEEPPYYYGSYYGYTAWVEVTADQTLCDGTYQIPFTVTDSDGNAGQATLTVHVQDNRPPQASPPYLHGETTVTLAPAGLVHSPVVTSIPKICDPDGDSVFVRWGDLPPMYAQQISTFLGLLVMMYWPDGINVHCRERDVLWGHTSSLPGGDRGKDLTGGG